MIDRPGHVAIPEAVNMVNVLVVGIGNFTEDDTYDNLSSSVQEVAELLVEQGMYEQTIPVMMLIINTND